MKPEVAQSWRRFGMEAWPAAKAVLNS